MTIFRTTYLSSERVAWSERDNDNERILLPTESEMLEGAYRNHHLPADVRVCRAVECSHCEMELYRTDGLKIICPFGAGVIELCLTMTIANQMLTFCSRDCAVWWLRKQPEDKLCSGYPLF